MAPRIATGLLLAVAVTSGACVLPVTRTSTRSLGQERSAVTVLRTGMIRLTSSVGDGIVTVVAARPRTCRADVIDVVEETRELRAELDGPNLSDSGGGADGGGIALAVLLVGSLVVTGIVTGIIVLVDQPETTVQRVPQGPTMFACPEQVAGLAVQLRLASGLELEGVTSPQGAVAFRLPPDQAAGPMTVRATGTAELDVEYPAKR